MKESDCLEIFSHSLNEILDDKLLDELGGESVDNYLSVCKRLLGLIAQQNESARNFALDVTYTLAKEVETLLARHKKTDIELKETLVCLPTKWWLSNAVRISKTYHDLHLKPEDLARITVPLVRNLIAGLCNKPKVDSSEQCPQKQASRTAVEQQAIRFICGAILKGALKEYARRGKEENLSLARSFVSPSAVDDSSEVFLNLVDRGGLVRVVKPFFDFFHFLDLTINKHLVRDPSSCNTTFNDKIIKNIQSSDELYRQFCTYLKLVGSTCERQIFSFLVGRYCRTRRHGYANALRSIFKHVLNAQSTRKRKRSSLLATNTVGLRKGLRKSSKANTSYTNVGEKENVNPNITLCGKVKDHFLKKNLFYDIDASSLVIAFFAMLSNKD